MPQTGVSFAPQPAGAHAARTGAPCPRPPPPPVPASALAAAQWVRLTRSSGSGASRAPLLAFGCPPCEATFTSH